MSRISFKIFAVLIAFMPLRIFAAACCGGSLAAPSLILGDDKGQLTGSYTYSSVQDDVYENGLWKARAASETSEMYRIDYAHIIAERWQVGASVPFIRRARNGESSTGFGDLAGNLGYEYLTDWDYSPWRPHAVVFLQLTVPTGKAVTESDSPFQLDGRGRGFFGLSIGTVLTKIIDRWDLFANFEGHRSLAKDYVNGETRGVLHPGYGGTLALGAGYNLQNFRFGGSLAWTYEDAIAVTGDTTASGAVQRFATASLNASYLLPHEWTLTASYADQTWFGEPTNTTLSRSGMLQLQKRWPR